MKVLLYLIFFLCIFNLLLLLASYLSLIRHIFVDPFLFLFIIIAHCLYKQTSKKKLSWKKYVIIVVCSRYVDFLKDKDTDSIAENNL